MKNLKEKLIILIIASAYTLPVWADEVFFNETYAIGTLITSQVKAPTQEKADFCHKLVNDETRRLEGLLSAYDTDSDLNRLGNNAGQWVEVAPETVEVLRLSSTVAEQTNGTFDPTVGTLVRLWSVDQDSHRVPSAREISDALQYVNYRKIRTKEENGKYFAQIGKNQTITLGAIGKGYIADKVIELLNKNDCTNSLLSFGGNIIGNGTNAKDKPWRIGLQIPGKERGEYFAVLDVDNTSIVTSGDYEKYFIQDGVKYHHLLNPQTGKPVPATLSSITIRNTNSALADALCTALFVMGWDEAQVFLKAHPSIEAVLMNEDKNKIAYTKNLEGQLQIVDPSLQVELIK